MKELKTWKWEDKERTMLRKISVGDIFCLTKDNSNYHFGKILSKMIVGHAVEILNITKDSPSITQQELEQSALAGRPLLLDSYALFDKKIDKGGDWRIIGHQEISSPESYRNYYFLYGTHNNWKKVNILNEEVEISNTETLTLPLLKALSNHRFWETINEELKLNW
ncbi:Imm26 family immunity protein [Pseudomonas putida]|uniref:Imm26 family immunity protein n=1 Tax=Pseudomonas putida TaxID=303 RepID=UPI002AC52400|nr:Imm26 family immunity protein [Pseudomonas putida]MDZ5110328.1 Imm26 family immunity protein [Pseudomonas putida]